MVTGNRSEKIEDQGPDIPKGEALGPLPREASGEGELLRPQEVPKEVPKDMGGLSIEGDATLSEVAGTEGSGGPPLPVAPEVPHEEPGKSEAAEWAETLGEFEELRES